MANKMKIEDDVVVTIHYTLTLDDGEVVDSTQDDDPFSFLQGFGDVVPGLEEALYGMMVGERKQVVVEVEDGYGDYDEEDFEEIPRSEFPRDFPLEEGMEITLSDESGEEMVEGYIAQILPDMVIVDFNHPLAEERLHYDIEIVNIRPATEEELAHGHLHFDDDED